jgi:hypothetical protein
MQPQEPKPPSASAKGALPARVWLTPKEAAAYLGLSEKTLEGMRSRGVGPGYVKPSPKCIRYHVHDHLDAWLRGSGPEAREPAHPPVSIASEPSRSGS